MRFNNHRRRGDSADRREILLHVIAGIGAEANARQQHHDGVAVRRGLCGIASADHAAGAAAVLDNDLLAERSGELLTDESAHGVNAAAGRVRHDQGDRPCWIVLRDRRTELCTERSRGDGGA